MRNKYIVILLILSLTSFGQNKFIGKYKKFHEFSDTLKDSFQEPLNFRRFEIKDDFTYIYTEGQDPLAFSNPYKESIKGSWKADGDTIIFYNKNYIKPKGVKFNYIENQDFKGIKIVAKDKKGKSLRINYCTTDSLAFDSKTLFSGARPYKVSDDNYIYVIDTSYTAIYFQPQGFCNENGICEISVNLEGIHSGIVIEIICYSNDIEIRFDGKKYILNGNILHEKSTSRIMPDAWTDNYMRKK